MTTKLSSMDRMLRRLTALGAQKIMVTQAPVKGAGEVASSCINCKKWRHEHADGKCLFDGTTFLGDRVVIDFTHAIHRELVRCGAKPDKLIGRDTLQLIWDPSDPNMVQIYSDMESHHNGSAYDTYRDKVPLHIDMIKAFIVALDKLLRQDMAERVREAAKREAEKEFNQRVEAALAFLALDG